MSAVPAPITGKYLLTRQLFKLVGANFRITDQSGQLVYFCHQKGFKLKEDIRIYRDEAQTQEVLRIAARQIIDFSAAYDVFDSASGQKLGAYKRKGWSSLVRDEWILLGPMDEELGKVIEDSLFLALVRRWLIKIIPQNYDLLLNDGSRAVDLRQNFNPFMYKLEIDFTVDPAQRLDQRMGIVAGILLAAIEGKQR
jgi:uncharacterized protein YxjI